ncbi:alpha/beta fold hydrolase [Streptomyces longwoodensis]|uniref:alpha/beta fold hydrolase n=1 Tax=Streptomyces longwoodensis TaxID=68231 RepID=UPI0037B066CC
MTAPAPARPGRTYRTVHTDDGADLAVRVHGPADAGATVLLSHGWTMSACDWRPHVDALARPRPGFPALRTVTYDQRGHGASGRGTARLDMALLGDDLARVLDATTTSYGGPVLLVGHSMGGMAIQQLAARHPGLFGTRVAGVALVSTCLDGVGDAPPASAHRLDRRQALARRHTTDALLRSPRCARAVHRLLTGPLSHPTTAPLWRALLGGDGRGAAARADARALRHVPVLTIAEFLAALTTHDCAGRLAALARVPTRVLVGTRDRYTPPDQARRLARAVPGAALQLVPGQGHDLPYERPVLVVETVHALLREVRRLGRGTAEAPDGPPAVRRAAVGTAGAQPVVSTVVDGAPAAAAHGEAPGMDDTAGAHRVAARGAPTVGPATTRRARPDAVHDAAGTSPAQEGSAAATMAPATTRRTGTATPLDTPAPRPVREGAGVAAVDHDTPRPEAPAVMDTVSARAGGPAPDAGVDEPSGTADPLAVLR